MTFSLCGTAVASPTITKATGEGVQNDVWDTHRGAILMGSSGMSYPGTAAFGALEATNESSHAIFVDYAPPDGVDWIEMQTPKPVTVTGYNLILMEDSPLGERAAQHVALEAYDSANTVLTPISASDIAAPYAASYGGNEILVSDHFTPVTARRWRFEITRAPAPGRVWGSRIVEWDAISPALGDINGDGTIGFGDLLILAQHYGATKAAWATGDLNGDGIVNFTDLLILVQRYPSTAAGPMPVPEPSSLVAMIGTAVVLVRRRR